MLVSGGTQLRHIIINVRDEPEEDLLAHLSEALQAIREAQAQGIKLLVHCFAGVSRSATVVIAYLMFEAKRRGETPPFLGAAFRRVSTARPRCDPNPGFIRQLLALEAMGCPEPLPEKETYQPLVEVADITSIDIAWSEVGAAASREAREAEERIVVR